jgi:hypothetical protein
MTGVGVACLAGAVACLAAGFAALWELRRRLRLVARAEHELRGPATALGLACERIRRDPAAAPHVEVLEAQLERLRAGLADLAAARRGGRADGGALSHVDLGSFVWAALEPWRAALPHVSLDWRAGSAATVTDRGRLAQAVGNLVANSAEHGAGPLDVRVRRIQGGIRIEFRNRNREASRSREGEAGAGAVESATGAGAAGGAAASGPGGVAGAARTGGAAKAARAPETLRAARAARAAAIARAAEMGRAVGMARPAGRPRAARTAHVARAPRTARGNGLAIASQAARDLGGRLLVDVQEERTLAVLELPEPPRPEPVGTESASTHVEPARIAPERVNGAGPDHPDPGPTPGPDLAA